jgi:cGMP-dependent protein kinase 2
MRERYRIAIIGSGPAGLSAAARAAERGVSHILLEKTDHLSDTIFKYQKGKHVMATPSSLVLRSDLDFAAGKREAILGTWDAQIAAKPTEVRFNADVTKISGEQGAFTITLRSGDTIEAETVVLAIGTQGNPNMLRCEGGDLPHIQYQLDDPGEYMDEHIVVIGTGDAGIENALGLAADPVQRNTVTILNRGAEFARAKPANVKLLQEAASNNRVIIRNETTPAEVRPGELLLDSRDGQETIRCDRIIARMGSTAPRAFVESCGVTFSSADREAFPTLSPTFETSTPGIYVIGALAGYPLIKHCMNQGYDVVEFIEGNVALKPADEPILEAKLAHLPAGRSVEDWLELFRRNIHILNELTALQLREMMLDSEVRSFGAGEVIFRRNEPGSSLFCVATGSVLVEVDAVDTSRTVPIATGSIFGEVGLISGRRRGATIRAAEPTIVIELSRNAALKLLATAPAAARAVARISIERQLLQIFGTGLTAADIAELVDAAEVETKRAGEIVLREGDLGKDVYFVRRGSMIVEKQIGGKPVFLSYLPAGAYVGEMALLGDAPRSATVKAAIRSEVVRLPGDAFQRLLDRKPGLRTKLRADMAKRVEVNAFVESRKESFSGAVDMYSETAQFLIDNGIGEATDVLLIDEKLCVGCDNCEKACADSHEGLSRLNREAGKSYARLHVPTSCRHCEHPHCMADCPPNAIHRGADGEVFIDAQTCIGCGNCQRNCPYDVIRMDSPPPKKPALLSWMLFGAGPGPGEPSKTWRKKHVPAGVDQPKKAIKCDMCAGISGGPACVRACPTGAAIRVSPESFLSIAKRQGK